MNIQEALKIVYDLAYQNKIDDLEDIGHECRKQNAAFHIMNKFLLNLNDYNSIIDQLDLCEICFKILAKDDIINNKCLACGATIS